MISFGGVDFVGENRTKQNKKIKSVIWHSSVTTKGEGSEEEFGQGRRGKGMKWMSHEEKRPCSCRLGKVLSSVSHGFRDRHWAEVCHDLSKDPQWWPRI